jgi:small-conductance mechanosensitive channel
MVRTRSLYEWLATFHLDSTARDSLIQSAVVLVALGLIRGVVARLLVHRIQSEGMRYRWRKVATYSLSTIGLILIGRIWSEGFGTLTTAIGLLSAAVALALRDVVVSFAGWFYILWQRPFQVGHRVEIGDAKGDIVDIGILRFTMVEISGWVDADQSTGRIMYIPNSHVFSHRVANSTEGFNYIWDELPVLVTFESDWRKAKQVLTDIAQRHGEVGSEAAERDYKRAARKYLLLYSTLTPIVYTSVRDSGILLTMRYLCDPRTRRGMQQSIWEDVLDAFQAAPDIDFAYPTQRFYDNASEGKAPPGS